MGQMKDFLITVHNGGDEAVAAVQRVGEDWRTQLEQAAAEIARLRLTDEEREAVDKMRVRLYEISRDNAFIDEVCDDAKAACEAIAAFLERHK